MRLALAVQLPPRSLRSRGPRAPRALRPFGARCAAVLRTLRPLVRIGALAVVSVSAVLFDLDGVLVDTYEAWFSLMNAAVRDMGFPPVARERFRASWGQSTEADARDFFPGRAVEEVT